MLNRILLMAIIALVSLSLNGCMVTKSTYLQKVADAEKLDQDLAALQKQYKAVNAENDGLKAQLAKLTDELAGANRDREKLSTDNKDLQQVLKAKSDALSKNIVDLRQRIADVEAENVKLKGDVATLQKVKEEKVREVSKTYEQLLDKMKNEIAQGQVTISELKGKLTVNLVEAILFDSGKAEVKPGGLTVLQKVVDILKNVKDKSIRIEGHTDNVPIVGTLTKKYPTNWELSAARAINVSRYLQQQGIDPANLSAVAFGEYKPVADNSTDEGRAKNRRIEITLVPKE